LDPKDFSIKLDIHDTKDIKNKHVNGSLTVIWRDYDKILKNSPNMVYVSSVKSGEITGPHLHTKRNSYFVCIEGKVVFIIKNSNGEFLEIESSSENGTMVFVPKNFSSAHINLSDKTSRVLTLADIAWRENDNEMENVEFDDYDWQKWKK
jgi:dTDP-4-dehydrorhamnose 3,5-epimerase